MFRNAAAVLRNFIFKQVKETRYLRNVAAVLSENAAKLDNIAARLANIAAMLG